MDSADRRETDEEIEEALEETFPASDPPANTVETGIRISREPLTERDITIRDNRDASRFEVVQRGERAILQYERRPDAFVLLHTEVPEALRGRGIGGRLARTALQTARAERLPIEVRCPFVRAYMRDHPGA